MILASKSVIWVLNREKIQFDQIDAQHSIYQKRQGTLSILIDIMYLKFEYKDLTFFYTVNESPHNA